MTNTWPTDADVEKAAIAAYYGFVQRNKPWKATSCVEKEGWLASARAALSAANPFEWREIETAPKTTTAILVFCPTYRNTYIVSWIIPLDDNANPDPDHGFWCHFGAGGSRLNDRPSKWMPLPPSPQEGK